MTDECVSAVLRERERCIRLAAMVIRKAIEQAESAGEVEATYTVGAALMPLLACGISAHDDARVTGN